MGAGRGGTSGKAPAVRCGPAAAFSSFTMALEPQRELPAGAHILLVVQVPTPRSRENRLHNVEEHRI